MIICSCGYEAEDINDFDEHQLASMHSDEDHFETRQGTGGRESGGCICSGGMCIFDVDPEPNEFSCPDRPTQEDLLCDSCRDLKGKKHCHLCGGWISDGNDARSTTEPADS